MNIDKVKLDEGISVDYSTLLESFRISSVDDPSSEFYSAAGKLISQALQLFGLSGIRTSLQSVEISHGENPGSRITLKAPTADGGMAKIVCPKVDRKPLKDWERGGELVDHPQNHYNEALDAFIAQAESYVRGKRLQMSLFDSQQVEAEADGDDGYSDDMDSVADRVMAFPGR